MYILHYNLEILPPLIPYDFIIFHYNRVVNFDDENVIANINFKKCHLWSVEDLFDLLIKQIRSMNLDFILVDEYEDYYEKDENVNSSFKKIKSNIIRHYMTTCPMWAINHSKIIKFPNQLINQHCILRKKYESKEEYIFKLVKRSLAIRTFLLKHGNCVEERKTH